MARTGSGEIASSPRRKVHVYQRRPQCRIISPARWCIAHRVAYHRAALPLRRHLEGRPRPCAHFGALGLGTWLMDTHPRGLLGHLRVVEPYLMRDALTGHQGAINRNQLHSTYLMRDALTGHQGAINRNHAIKVPTSPCVPSAINSNPLHSRVIHVPASPCVPSAATPSRLRGRRARSCRRHPRRRRRCHPHHHRCHCHRCHRYCYCCLRQCHPC